MRSKFLCKSLKMFLESLWTFGASFFIAYIFVQVKSCIFFV